MRSVVKKAATQRCGNSPALTISICGPNMHPQKKEPKSVGTQTLKQLDFSSAIDIGENADFLKEQLITYIGNKRLLLPFIGEAVHKVQRILGKNKLRMLDLFSGTGIVSRYFKQYASQLFINDLEAYSKVTSDCYLSNGSNIDQIQLHESLEWLEKTIHNNWVEGFISELYAPKNERDILDTDRVFYTRRNAAYIDSARLAISKMPKKLQKFFLAPLIAKASVHANTSGVFKGFYKNDKGVGQYGGNAKDALKRILGEIKIDLPVFSRYECEVEVTQKDANEYIKTAKEVDLAYFDPPYNQHPYGSNYFMLNLIADYKRPTEVSEVSGIPTNWNRSKYNKRNEAAEALFEAVAACPAHFVLISYNSEGFVKQEQFTAQLKEMGKVSVCETPYNTFRGSRNLSGRSIHVTEFLYLLNKN
jgi:adenine-specific DNA-methyltransferase